MSPGPARFNGGRGGGVGKKTEPDSQVETEKIRGVLRVLKSTSRRKILARSPTFGHTGKENPPLPLSQRKTAQFELE